MTGDKYFHISNVKYSGCSSSRSPWLPQTIEVGQITSGVVGIPLVSSPLAQIEQKLKTNVKIPQNYLKHIYIFAYICIVIIIRKTPLNILSEEQIEYMHTAHRILAAAHFGIANFPTLF